MTVREKYRSRPPLPADLEMRLGRLPSLMAAHGVRLAYLFGSAARPGDRPPADVDLAVLPGRGFAFRPFYADLSRALGTDRIDLVDLRRAPAALCRNVIASGRVVYKESDALENRFELSVLARMRDEHVRLSRWLAGPVGRAHVRQIEISRPGAEVKHGPSTRQHPEDGP